MICLMTAALWAAGQQEEPSESLGREFPDQVSLQFLLKSPLFLKMYYNHVNIYHFQEKSP
ncbi:MAG: hypothetical protein B6241_12885 [Spirochaetaceae bacterium 4572_59]|nr:MAG: hypothetical protein B6241_12885 [Spirochaetaceae bacterium 4572_59]